MFGFGTPELLLFAVVVLILFGRRIPAAMHSLGQGLREFKRGIHESQSESDLVNVP